METASVIKPIPNRVAVALRDLSQRRGLAADFLQVRARLRRGPETARGSAVGMPRLHRENGVDRCWKIRRKRTGADSEGNSERGQISASVTGAGYEHAVSCRRQRKGRRFTARIIIDLSQQFNRRMRAVHDRKGRTRRATVAGRPRRTQPRDRRDNAEQLRGNYN